MSKLTPKEIKAVIKCLKEEIDVNNRVLSNHTFDDEEDLKHFDYIDDYNKKLKSAKEKMMNWLK